jgi:hypothetical protein
MDLTDIVDGGGYVYSAAKDGRVFQWNLTVVLPLVRWKFITRGRSVDSIKYIAMTNYNP